ncbi:hypothetical protein [Mycetocola spongiae]|uniref:hypothetical protein n=1 Tax=Mycetocola spongiae TaxID=2859226 RepID=UPI001CF43AB6|nr:hypothetical protein [Mycetocola spongiae]UCR89716.1 hypothetical protein KXZ72_03300 [Mycetocola spongiae]
MVAVGGREKGVAAHRPALRESTLRMKRICMSIIAGAMVTALGVVLVSCAGSPGDPEPNDAASSLPRVSIDEFAGVTAHLDFIAGTVELPLASLSTQSAPYVTRVNRAIDALTDSCMQQKGFLSPPSPDRNSEFAESENREFGQWSVSIASEFGFALPPNTGHPPTDTLALGVPYNADFPGCMEDAKQQLIDSLEYLEAPNIDFQIGRDAHQFVVESTEGREALGRRAECIEQKGVILDPNRIELSEQYLQQPPETQIAAATAEAECAVSTGAIQELFNLQARYQSALMRDHEAALEEHRTRMDQIARTLDSVIREGKVR